MTTDRKLSDAERHDWLRLIRSENVGPRTFFRLLEHFGSAAAALDGAPELSRRGGRKRVIRIADPATADAEIDANRALGARLVAHGEADYPDALAAIDDPPPLIGIIGDASLLSRPCIAIVGARNASAAGRRIARELAAELGEAGYVVCSGMARGIDAAAHQSALGGGTVAALAGGVDNVYPPENQALYDEIAARGALMSEQPAGTEPTARHFPPRNRLIAGLAQGVVVVEAATRSGSLITARLALEQGREIFAVPGSPLDPRARGPNRLIRDGATLVETASDIVDSLAGPLSRRRVMRTGEPAPPHPDPEAALGDSDVADARQSVIEMLGATPVTVDELVRECQLSPPAVQTALLELELAGRVERQPGNRVSLVA